jgi:hypothetical protein
VRCGVEERKDENEEEWDGMESLWRARLRSFYGGKQKWLPHIAGEARSLRVNMVERFFEMIQMPFCKEKKFWGGRRVASEVILRVRSIVSKERAIPGGR